MALEMGLGVTPWSPLKGGVLSGKYTRANAGRAQSARGEWVTRALNERAYQVIEVLSHVAREVDSTPARVALAWVQARPGVVSPIIGARSVSQLEDNLGALDVQLRPEHRAALDAATKPTLDFPAAFLENVPNFAYGGTTINGRSSQVLPMTPQSDAERY